MNDSKISIIKMEKNSENINFITQLIYDKKGFNILVLDVKDISTITDYFIIAEGNVDRHVSSIAQNIIDELKTKRHITPSHVEGKELGDWVVIDYLNVMIHLFIPSLREKYQLEKLWDNGKIVDVAIDVNNKN